MDYLEGLFLGSLWSDTDYENRRHMSLFVLYGMAVCGIVVLSYFTGKFASILSGQQLLKYAVFFTHLLASPFLHFRYYRFPLWGKLPVLLLDALKYFVLTVILTSWVMPFLSFSAVDMQTKVVDFLNHTLETSTKMFVQSAGTFSTVLGVITGGIYVVFLFAVVLVLAVLVPGTFFLIVRLIQRGYDYLVSKFIMGNMLDR